MPTVTIKIPTLTSPEAASAVQGAIQRLKGINSAQADPATHNLTVAFDEGPQGTTLTAIQVALQLAGHRHGAFAAGQKKRGWV